MALGDTYTANLTVTNNGPATANGVTATATRSGPAAWVVSAEASQGSCTVSESTMECLLGSLSSGTSASVDIVIEPASTGGVTLTGASGLAGNDPAPANNVAVRQRMVDNAHGCTILGTPHNDTDVIYGGSGNDAVNGGDGADTAAGGLGADVLIGGIGPDDLDGGAHDDTLFGDDGSDRLRGGDGNDYLFGSDGADNLIGSLGTDHLMGGDGVDTCAADGSDTISGCAP